MLASGVPVARPQSGESSSSVALEREHLLCLLKILILLAAVLRGFPETLAARWLGHAPPPSSLASWGLTTPDLRGTVVASGPAPVLVQLGPPVWRRRECLPSDPHPGALSYSLSLPP